MGDVKLLAAAGAWVGWQGLPWLLLIAAAAALAVVLIAAVVRRRLTPAAPIPFGPFLCLALWLVWLYGAPRSRAEAALAAAAGHGRMREPSSGHHEERCMDVIDIEDRSRDADGIDAAAIEEALVDRLPTAATSTARRSSAPGGSPPRAASR